MIKIAHIKKMYKEEEEVKEQIFKISRVDRKTIET